MKDKVELLASVLSHLLTLDVRIWNPDRSDLLSDFEKENCFDPSIQPFYRAGNLSLLLASAKEGYIYEIRDVAETGLILFGFGGDVLFAGPYVRTAFDAERARQMLIRNHLPAARSAEFQLYYTALPLISLQTLLHTLKGCLEAFDDSGRIYSHRLLHGITEHGDTTASLLEAPEPETYDAICSRYEAENDFIDAIAAGDLERMLSTYDYLGNNVPRPAFDIFVGHTDPLLGLTVLRTLARKAAESGGLSVIDVDRITQKAVQRSRGARTTSERIQIHKEMLLELTQAVHDTRLQVAGCSAPIRKCLEYIGQHFSRNIRVSQLCNLTGLSASRLSTLFRRETGQTLTGCIRHLRCQEAARMLKKTDLPVQEISFYVGYPDNNYFVKVFRSEYGVTPTDYRSKKGEAPVFSSSESGPSTS